MYRNLAKPFAIIGVAIAALIYSALSNGQTMKREQLIREILLAQQGGKLGTAETQMAQTLLQSAKRVNPNVSEDKWHAVENSVTEGVVALAAQGQGPIETAARAGSANLSDEELAHLLSVLRDPVLAKFSSAGGSPEVQAQVRQAALRTGLQVNTLINSVLIKNGLQGIH